MPLGNRPSAANLNPFKCTSVLDTVWMQTTALLSKGVRVCSEARWEPPWPGKQNLAFSKHLFHPGKSCMKLVIVTEQRKLYIKVFFYRMQILSGGIY